MNTMWTNEDGLKINPPCWKSAAHFLDTFTYLESEFGIVDLVATDMFDLTHPGTAEELDLPKALRAIRQKSSLAKSVVKWIAENRDVLDDYPQQLREQGPVARPNKDGAEQPTTAKTGTAKATQPLSPTAELKNTHSSDRSA